METDTDRPANSCERRLSGQNAPAERWMTYAEAGRSLGISAEAARQLAKRRGWPRRKPNEHNALATVRKRRGGSTVAFD
jgi:hypothetical protein